MAKASHFTPSLVLRVPAAIRPWQQNASGRQVQFPWQENAS